MKVTGVVLCVVYFEKLIKMEELIVDDFRIFTKISQKIACLQNFVWANLFENLLHLFCCGSKRANK